MLITATHLLISYRSFSLIFSLLAFSLPSLSWSQNHTGGFLVRVKRQYNSGPDPFHSLGGVNEDGLPRAPLVLEITHNLTHVNGPRGRCGVCARTYRVLNKLQHSPGVECERYSNSRQAALGDLTEFYHTVSIPPH